MPEIAPAAVDLETRLLIVDDDADIRALTASFLAQHGFRVDTAADGAAMRQAMANARYDAIVLDIMMPGEDGLSILRSLDRVGGPAVVMLSVIGTDVDRIVGLELGADDYLAKPVNPRELLARIRSVLRRMRGDRAGPIVAHAPSTARIYHRFAGWRLDAAGRQLFDPDDILVNLSDGEFRLLLALVEHPRRVLSRDQLLDWSRGPDAAPYDRAIDVQMSRLRRKLARATDDELVRTVRNEGYLFTADVKRG